jgi:hypothetical protein
LDGSFKASSLPNIIPNPLPTNQNVCIKTMTEEGKKNHPNDTGQEMVAQHVIRIMCKVASGEDDGKK